MAWRRVTNNDPKSFDFSVHAVKLLAEAQETVDGVTQLVMQEANSVSAAACALDALVDLGEQARTVLEFYPQTYIPNRDLPIKISRKDIAGHGAPRRKSKKHSRSCKRARVCDSELFERFAGSSTWSETSDSDRTWSEASDSDRTWSEASDSDRTWSETSDSYQSSSSNDSYYKCPAVQGLLRENNERQRNDLIARLVEIRQATRLPIVIPEDASVETLKALLRTCFAIMNAAPQADSSCSSVTSTASSASSSSTAFSTSSASSDYSSPPTPSSLIPQPAELFQHLKDALQAKQRAIRQECAAIVKRHEPAVAKIIAEESVAKIKGLQSDETTAENIWSRMSLLTSVPVCILKDIVNIRVAFQVDEPQQEQKQEQKQEQEQEQKQEQEQEQEQEQLPPSIIQKLLEEVAHAMLSLQGGNDSDKEREEQLVNEVDNLVKKEEKSVSARDMFAPGDDDEEEENSSSTAKVTECVDWKSL